MIGEDKAGEAALVSDCALFLGFGTTFSKGAGRDNVLQRGGSSCALLDKAVQKRPKPNANLYELQAATLMRLGNSVPDGRRRATVAIRKAIALRPENAWQYKTHLGKLLEGEEAEECLQQVIDTAPSDPSHLEAVRSRCECMYMLSVVLAGSKKSKKKKKMKEYYQRANKLCQTLPIHWRDRLTAVKAHAQQNLISASDTFLRACGHCGQRSDKDLKRCAICRCVAYCDAKCQRNAWKAHKQICKAPE